MVRQEVVKKLLPSTEKAAEDCIKATFSQFSASLPGRKLRQHYHQEEEYHQAYHHIGEDRLQPALSQRQANKRTGQHDEHKQEAATPTQLPYRPPALLAILLRLVGCHASSKGGHEQIVLRLLLLCWRLHRRHRWRRIPWLRPGWKLACHVRRRCSDRRATGNTNSSSLCHRLSAVGTKSLSWLVIHRPSSWRIQRP